MPERRIYHEDEAARRRREAEARFRTELTIRVATLGPIPVRRLMDFIETVVGVAAEYGDKEFTGDLVSIRMGSIELVLAFSGVAIGMAQLALQIADHFRKDPIAAGRARSLIRYGPSSITFTGGGKAHVVKSEEIEAALRPAKRSFDGSTVTGFFMGNYFKTKDRSYAVLDSFPTQLLPVTYWRDPTKEEPLRPGRYLFEGIVELDSRGKALRVEVKRAERRRAR